MPRTDRGRLDPARLASYFRGGYKPRASWLVGVEVEKMGLVAATGKPLPYDGDGPSVRRVLEFVLRERGGDPVFEGDHLIGVEGSWGALSLEPGGQIEWSSRPAVDLPALRVALEGHLAAMRAAGEALGVHWLDVAVHPERPVSEMPWMPKARYAIMRRHLGARGRLAHRMMTQTASVQTAYDSADERDWSRKFRAAALLAPISVALFANSSRADGRESGYRSFRQAIWRETDPARCGLPSIVFEPGFGIEAWTGWAMNVPTIFFRREAGLLPSHGEPFSSLLARRGCDAMTIEDWELHLSTIFTEVRAYTYIEARSVDLLPDPLLPSVPAFWTGILYHDRAIDAAIDLCSAHSTYAAWEGAMEEASRKGIDGSVAGRPLRELVSWALGLSAWALRHGAACAGKDGDAARDLEPLAARHGVPLREIVA